MRFGIWHLVFARTKGATLSGRMVPFFLAGTLAVGGSLLDASPSEEIAPAPFRVASAHPLATEAGVEILEEGGNAVDAAVAIQAVLNVVEPQSSGIGGGCFLLYYSAATGRTAAIDGREEAPRQVYPELFLDAKRGEPIPFYPDRITGGRAVGVPGCVAALHKAWERYGSGRLKWRHLFRRAIDLADKGFPISGRLAEAIQGERDRLILFPDSRRIFLNPDGSPRAEGEILVQTNLAQTFRLIARHGPSVLYEGELARDIVKAVRESPVSPGLMSMEDLAGYQAPERNPVSGSYRGLTLYSMPLPSSGGVTVIEALNILEAFPVGAMGREDAEFIHLFSEAQKLAFADRNRYLGDADFTDIPLRDLLSKEWASSRGEAIRPGEVASQRAVAQPLALLGNTTTSHISIADAEGNVLAMTTTIEHIFGSALTVPGRGFILNNELTDFEARPYGENDSSVLAPNRVEGGLLSRRTSIDIPSSLGGKRPLSSMSPAILFKDGKPFAALGSPGGTQIIGIVLNLIVNLVDFQMSAADAIRAPRILNRNGPLELEAEWFGDREPVSGLRGMGHEVIEREPFGNAQLVLIREDGEPEGASDPRGEGKAQ